MTPALSLRDIHRSYRAGIAGCSATVQALRGIDLDVEPGEIVAIIGDRGAGKTTLLQCAAGQLRPDRGSVSWFGITGDAQRRPPGVVYVPEKAVYYSSLTVREALEYYATVTEVASAQRSLQVSEALRRCSLASDTERRIHNLTDAQLRRLGLAQALLASPRLLLIDSGFSERGRSAESAPLITDLASQGVGIVVAARTPDSVRSFATRILRLALGTLTDLVGADDRGQALELAVTSPIPDAERLSTRIAGIDRRGDRLRIPLRHHSPEEVLAQCRALGISVQRSRVIPLGARQ